MSDFDENGFRVVSSESDSSFDENGFRPISNAATGKIDWGKKLSAAVDNYQAGLWSIPAAAGSEYALNAMRENKEAAGQGFAEAGGPQSWDDMEFGKNFGQYFGHLLVQSAPYMAEFAATGFGVGSVLKKGFSTAAETIAAKAAQEAIKRGAVAETAATIGNAAADGFFRTIGGVIGSYPSSVGDVLSNQDEQSGKFNLPSAVALGVPYAALNAAGVEGMAMRGISRGLPAIAKEVGGKGVLPFAARAAVTGGEVGALEGATETGQEVLNQMGRMAVDPNATLTSGDAPERYKESFIAGGLMGGLPGAAVGGFRKAADPPKAGDNLSPPSTPSPDIESTVAPILNAGSVDDAITTANRLLDEPVAGLDDEFASLVKDEQIDLTYRRADTQGEAVKARDFDRAIAQADQNIEQPAYFAPQVRQDAITPAQADAMTRAQGFGEESPTAMQLALQKALQRKNQPAPAQDAIATEITPPSPASQAVAPETPIVQPQEIPNVAQAAEAVTPGQITPAPQIAPAVANGPPLWLQAERGESDFTYSDHPIDAELLNLRRIIKTGEKLGQTYNIQAMASDALKESGRLKEIFPNGTPQEIPAPLGGNEQSPVVGVAGKAIEQPKDQGQAVSGDAGAGKKAGEIVAVSNPSKSYADMSYDELESAISEANTTNDALDLAAVKKHIGSDFAAEFAKWNRRKRDKWLSENETEAMQADSSTMRGVDTETIAAYRDAANNFDTESPESLGRSIAIAAKGMDDPKFIGSPEYTTVRNALQYAKSQGWSEKAVLDGMRGRAVEWAGDDAPELFSRLFKAAQPNPEQRSNQPIAGVAPGQAVAARETITPSEDTIIGKNASGDVLYERADGSRYRMRTDRKGRPGGYPDFGGDLVLDDNVSGGRIAGELAPESPAPSKITPQPAADNSGGVGNVENRESSVANQIPVGTFTQRKDGGYNVTGYSQEVMRAAADKAGIKGAYIGKNGNSVIPKSANIDTLKDALGVPLPPATEVKPRGPVKHDTTTLFGAIKAMGGISSKYALDLTGETNPSKMKGIPVGLFKKDGHSPDYITRELAGYGFNINLEDPNDAGGVNQATELIRQAAGGSPVFSIERMEREFSQQEELKYKSELFRVANEYGVEYKRRPLPDVQNDVAKAIEAEIGIAGKQYAETKADAIARGALSENEADAIADRIADAYTDSNTLDKDVLMYREIAGAIEERINEHESQLEESQPVEQNLSPAEAGGRPSLDRQGQTPEQSRSEQERLNRESDQNQGKVSQPDDLLASYNQQDLDEQKARIAAAEKEAAKVEAELKKQQERLARPVGVAAKAKAEQVDLFNPQDSLFQRARKYVKDLATIDMFTSQLPTRPGEDTTATRTDRLGLTTNVLMRGSKGSLLGLALSTDWIRGKGSDLLGKRVTSAADLATLAAVLRDPRAETFRYFLIKDNKLVYHTAVTSNLPGWTRAHVGDNIESFLAGIKATMERLGADGYYLMHNHPSTLVRASAGDVATTTKIAQELPGFLGHVILDHTEFGLIAAYPQDDWQGRAISGDVKMVYEGAQPLEVSGPDPTRQGIKHPKLDEAVSGPSQLASVANFVRSPSNVVLVAADHQLKITGIMEVAADDMKQGTLTAYKNMVRLRKAAGSESIFAILPEGMKFSELSSAIKSRGWLFDVNSVVGTTMGETKSLSAAESGQAFGKRKEGKERTGIVEQPKAEYKAVDTESPAFRKWFGDSRVVDADGNPLVVYHGTGVNVGNRGEFMSGDFDTFNPEMSGKSSKTGAPEGSFFFTNSAEAASSYTVQWRGDFSETHKESANVMQVFLTIKKPLKVSAKGENWREILYKGEYRDINEVAQLAKESGKYDGVIIARVLDHGVGKTSGKPSTTYIAFRPEQIKSAISNTGQFNSNDPNILRQPAKIYGQAQLFSAMEEAQREEIAIASKPNSPQMDLFARMDKAQPVQKEAAPVEQKQAEPAETKPAASTGEKIAAADPVTEAKKVLDAAGITGTDRTTTIAAVRRGDLTAEDVAEAHPVAEQPPQGRYTVKPPSKLYRGIATGLQEDGKAGTGTFMLGRGIYSSPDKTFAKKYGDVVDVPIATAWPNNPLVLRNVAGGAPSAFMDWALKESGLRTAREFNKTYPDPGEFVRSRGYDGVIAGDEIVKYSQPTQEGKVATAEESSDVQSSQFSALEIDLAGKSHDTESIGDVGVVVGGGKVRYVSMDNAVNAVAKAIAAGTKTSPFQLHNATGIRIGDVDRVFKEVYNPSRGLLNQSVNRTGKDTPLLSKSDQPSIDKKAIESALKKRGVRGDTLLNTMDLIDDMEKGNGEITPDGFAILYHRTTSAAAKDITKTGVMTGKEDRLFFGTRPSGQIDGYGNSVVKVLLPLEKLELNDVFNGEAHVTIITNGKPLKVKAELVDPTLFSKSDQTAVFNPHTIESAKTALLSAHSGKIKAAIQAMFDAGKARVITAEQAAGIVGRDALFAKTNDQTVYWHGSASGDLRGGRTGLHLGTREAAKQALEARIGVPASGEWDGTREYGKTLLAGRKTLERMEKETGQFLTTGLNAGEARNPIPNEDYLPRKTLKYADGTEMPMSVKPNILPYRLNTEVSNSRNTPHPDYKANGYMRAGITKGNAKRGFYYKNEAEDFGSVSVVVPNGDHVVEVKYSKEGRALAFFNPADGITFFIADHIPRTYTDRQWAGLAAHELGVHALHLGKGDKEFNAILDQLETLRKLGSKKVIEAYDKASRALGEESLTWPGAIRQERLQNEAMGYLAQYYPTHSIVRRFLAWFRKSLRSIGEKFPAMQKMRWNSWIAELSENDLAFMAQDAIRNWQDSTVRESTDLAGAEGYASQEQLLNNATDSRPGAGLSVFEDPSDEETSAVQAGIEGKSVVEAAEFIARNAPDKSYRLIASRVAKRLREFEAMGKKMTLHVSHVGDDVPDSMLQAGIRGQVIQKPNDPETHIWLNGADVTGSVGMSYEIVLHELVHAATQKAIDLGEYGASGEIGAAAQDLFAVYRGVLERIAEKDRLGVPLNWYEQHFIAGRNNTLANMHELVSWAMTNMPTQAYLESIPYKNTTLWGRFVSAVRTFLGLPESADTALSEVIGITDRLMNIDVTHLMIESMRQGVHMSRNRTRANRDGTGREIVNSSKTSDKIAGMNSVLSGAMDIADNFAGKSVKSLGKMNGVITQLHKARNIPEFARVFTLAMEFRTDLSRSAYRAWEQAKDILPAYNDIGSATKSLLYGKKHSKELSRVASWVFDGTTYGGGNPLAGMRWTASQLKNNFQATDREMAMYEQARDAIDTSLTEVANSVAWKLAKPHIGTGSKKQVIDNPESAHDIMREALELVEQSTETEEEKVSIVATMAAVDAVYEQADKLKAAGYAPLSRFGRYTVDVFETGPDGKIARDNKGVAKRLEFQKFEFESEARSVEKQLRKEYAGRPNVAIKRGIQAEKTLFSGVDPETVTLFAEKLADIPGIDVKREVLDEWRREAVSQRSAIMHNIKRKGIAGYSEDMPRVLATFLTSNARYASSNFHMADMQKAIDDIPDAMGDVHDEAQDLYNYINASNEPGQWMRGLMFAWYLGGSPAAALVNMSQPVLMTFPYLSQFGVGSAAKYMKSSVIQAMKPALIPMSLRQPLNRAMEEGIVEAQEIHHLYDEGMKPILARLPGGEDLRARAQGAATLWGAFFGMAENFNRRITFLSAYKMAQDMGNEKLKEKGFEDAYAFARRAVEETQGIYSKENRPNWARGTGTFGAVGVAAMTFKQYSIQYVELLNRMWKSGPEGKKAAGLMLGLLILASGIQGIPGADDLDDLIDTLLQSLGYRGNFKKAKRDALKELAGERLADIVMYGLSAETPIDVQTRLGLGNMLPATGVFKPSEQNKASQFAEILGPPGGMARSVGDFIDAAQSGQRGSAFAALSPVFIRNIAKAAQMMESGEYKDSRGRKVEDVDPVDAIWKGIGFQPQNVAGASRKAQMVRQDIARVKGVESDIASIWAQGVAEKDQDEVKRARQMLKDWNDKNSETPIRINYAQILRRVREIKRERSDRLAKTAPKELRRYTRDALN